jgi:hypothetical protein
MSMATIDVRLVTVQRIRAALDQGRGAHETARLLKVSGAEADG